MFGEKKKIFVEMNHVLRLERYHTIQSREIAILEK